MKSFLIKLFVFSFIIGSIDYCWNTFLPATSFIPRVWLSLGFFIGITILFHVLIMNAAKGKPQNFIRFYMGITALRMAVCLLVIIVYIVADKPTAMAFTLAFLIHYMLYTVFEVVLLQRLLKK